MYTSLPELSKWHQKNLTVPIYDPNFSAYFGAPGAGGAWQVTRYHDVLAVLADHATFSSEYIPKTNDNIFTRNLNVTDPPRHKFLRSLATKAFSPAIISQSEDWIALQCKELLQPWLGKGEIDFVQDFAIQLPHRVVSKLLGVQGDDVEQVRKWILSVAGDPQEIGLEVFGLSMQEMSQFFMDLIKERTAKPRQDLLTHLIQTEENGQRLDTMDVVAMCVAIYLGGYETTKSSLTNALFVFAQLPEVQKHLALNPTDISKAITEAIRLVTPVLGFPRIATRDTILSGKEIKKSDLLNVSISTANRDSDIFINPDTFDMNRKNLNQVMSFGHGIHYCLGAPLARVETRIAFETIFRKLKVISLKDPSALELDKSNLVYSLKRLPISFAYS